MFLVVGYAGATWLWWRAGRKTQLAADCLLWRLGAVLLFILALNKLFNLRLVSEAACALWRNPDIGTTSASQGSSHLPSCFLSYAPF